MTVENFSNFHPAYEFKFDLLRKIQKNTKSYPQDGEEPSLPCRFEKNNGFFCG